MHKSNNAVNKECINVRIVNRYLIQKKTYTNMLKFIQMLKEVKKFQVNKKSKNQAHKITKKK